MVNRKRIFLIVFMLLFPWGGTLFSMECPRETPPMNPELHKCMVQAEKLMNRGRNKQALTLLDTYAQKNPSEKHPHPVFVRGLLNYRLKRLKKAEALFKTAVDLNPCFVEAWQNLAVVYHDQKRPARAAKSMEQVLTLSKGEQPDLKYQVALCWLAAAKPGKALPLLQALSRKKSPRPEWLISLGEAQKALGQSKNAAMTLEKAYRNDHNPERLYQAALLALKAKAPEKALPSLKKLAATPHPDPKWIILLGLTLDQLDRGSEALAAMERTDVDDPSLSAEMRFQVGIFWLKRERPKKAVAWLESVFKGPNPPEGTRRAYVRALVLAGKPHQADPLLGALLKENPEDHGIWRLAAWVYMEQKDYPRAAAALHVAYRLNPPNPGDWKRLGDLYRLSGVPIKAVDAYEKAFGPLPGANDLDLLAETYIEGRRIKKALAAAERAVRLKPTAKRWARLGDLCLKCRECRKAKSAFQQAARIDDKGGLMSLKEGYAAWQLREMACAKDAFQKALQHAEPKSDTALKASHALAAIRKIMDAAQN